MPVLQVDKVDVSFGGVRALVHVSLDVDGGTVTGLIGPNGAGKTTLFNVVTGLQRPSGGHVRLNGQDITAMRPHVRSQMGIARTFQRLELFGSLTALENVRVADEIHRGLREGAESKRVAREILDRVGLSEVAGVQADTLPTGMARLVELGRALATRPRVLLLDEPSSGLTEAETQTLGQLLLALANDGMAILLVEHDVELVMRVCSKVNVLDFGEMIAAGTPEQVQRDPAVQAAYLGGDEAASTGDGSRPAGSEAGVQT